MMLVLYGISSLIIRIKAIELGSIKAWVDNVYVTSESKNGYIRLIGTQLG